jgi:hypothetical protein
MRLFNPRRLAGNIARRTVMRRPINAGYVRRSIAGTVMARIFFALINRR